MPTINPLSQAYFTRANVPFTDTSTTNIILKHCMWSLKALLLDQVTTGVTGGIRNPNSVWTTRYSCDSVTAGTAGDGVDRWGSTFNASKIIISGGAHSWYVLRNSTLGYELCIDAAGDGTSSLIGLSATRVSAPFTGGTTTTPPSAAGRFALDRGFTGNTFGFTLNTNTSPNKSLAVAGSYNLAHITLSPSGEFIFLLNRVGAGGFGAFISLMNATGGRSGDTRNTWLIAADIDVNVGGDNGRYPNADRLSCVRRSFTDSAPALLYVGPNGGVQRPLFGVVGYHSTSNGPNGYLTDSVTGEVLAFPFNMVDFTGGPLWCGTIPDLYWIGPIVQGAAYPSTINQERIVAGDILVPFTGVAPII